MELEDAIPPEQQPLTALLRVAEADDGETGPHVPYSGSKETAPHGTEVIGNGGSRESTVDVTRVVVSGKADRRCLGIPIPD